LIYIYCDGASRGNPGPASIGVVAYRNSESTEVVFTISEKIGKETNNVAEWTALLFALQKCKELSEKDIKIHLDSELVVRQMQGIYMKTSKQLERYFKGVANSRRLDILRLVGKNDGMTLENISEALDCNIKTISEHTRRLVEAGLLNKKHQGRFVGHSMSPYGKKFLDFFQTF
jgi:ribonuclease HI